MPLRIPPVTAESRLVLGGRIWDTRPDPQWRTRGDSGADEAGTAVVSAETADGALWPECGA